MEGLDSSGTLRLALMSPGLSLGTQALMWIWAELIDLILNKVRSDTTSESHCLRAIALIARIFASVKPIIDIYGEQLYTAPFFRFSELRSALDWRTRWLL